MRSFIVFLCAISAIGATNTINLGPCDGSKTANCQDSVGNVGLQGDQHVHKVVKRQTTAVNPEEKTAEFWNNNAQASLHDRISRQPNLNQAKNIIYFVGAGMSVPTITAARIYQGQLKGRSGEEEVLSFGKLPYTGITKTYCVDSQVAGTAGAATALLSGVKSNWATLGVTANVKMSDCDAENDPDNRLDSIFTWAQAAGKRTGVVTTGQVTHATPAAAYAHTSNRNWENDAVVISSGRDPEVCIDIAKQLVSTDPGRKLNVVLGGGRGEFRSTNVIDEQGNSGYRSGCEDLIETWLEDKKTRADSPEYVWNRDELFDVDTKRTDYLLGLFQTDKLHYHLDADQVIQPTLAEMTEQAIKILQEGDQGFVLLVEGDLINYAHHETKARKALDETLELAKAVDVALNMTCTKDTLIVVTSDHSQTMSISGYPVRGNPILSAPNKGNDHLPYATLSYANGPSHHVNPDGSRVDLSQENMVDKDFMFPGMVPLASSTRGGDDVTVHASGPWAHLFTGIYEQNVLPHIMAYAACIGSGVTMCNEACVEEKQGHCYVG